ncbi:MAG: hypothetical protein K8I27_07435 [Planctomycetes bacterium]|nr:hypothetical protein [Planctomycetota bacterium]
MKSGMLIIAVLASVIAGAGGGYVAATYGAPEKASNKVAVDAPLLQNVGDASAGTDHSDEIARLRADIGSMEVRMEGMVKADEYNALKTKYENLNERINELKSAPVVANSGGGVDGGAVIPADPDSAAFKEAVSKAMEEKDEADRAARAAEREKQMADMMAARNKTILDKLSTELGLTEVQKTNIDVILADMNTKRSEVMQRGRTARDEGIEFDWGTEMQAVSDASLEAVKAELSTAQVSTLTDLLGEGGNLDSLGGRGMGGGRRGGR